MDLCNINEIKALLARPGFHFSKAKGQNFLTQNWVPREIVARAGIDETCAALEVGPGIGPLTQELCHSAKKVIAIEVDRLIDGPTRDAKLQRIMDFITTAERADENVAIRLPGPEFTRLLEENRRNGITVDDSVWAKIQSL